MASLFKPKASARELFYHGEDGERLFFAKGFRQQPYLLPDAATEERLLKNQTVYNWTYVLSYLLGFPCFLFISNRFGYVGGMLAFILFIILIPTVIQWLLFRGALANLKRVSSPDAMQEMQKRAVKSFGPAHFFFSSFFGTVTLVVSVAMLARGDVLEGLFLLAFSSSLFGFIVHNRAQRKRFLEG